MYHPLWRSLRPLRDRLQLQSTRNVSDARPFAAGDLVILREKIDRRAQPILTKPLAPGKSVQGHKGTIFHDDIIWKRVRDVVSTTPSSKARPSARDNGRRKPGTDFRIHDVKLEEYVRLSRRLVTPVYPADAALIVEILDLHPATLHHPNNYSPDSEPPRLEVLEAGTGHGALTLYLSRALHPANAHLPVPSATSATEMESYKRARKAILHTIEAKPAYSAHAQSIVSGFRHGLYDHNVDFHVGDVGVWVRDALANRNHDPFLSHAILDLPSAEEQLGDVAKALRTDGTAVVFNPSITQILACLAKVKEEGIKLDLETVIELPSNGGARGREWDVRAVRPRALVKAEMDAEAGREGGGDGERDAGDGVVGDGDAVEGGDREEQASPSERNGKGDGWQMVCRPKVGDKIVGGGFLGVFKKWRE